ncbi:MAG: hypothetical protein J6I53_10000 [Treponema sp.]|nr:hypothetical protein [Treponema sp.]
MKKQIFALSIFVSLSFFLASCSSTQPIAETQAPEVQADEQADLTDDSFSQTQVDIAGGIADELNSASSAGGQDGVVYAEPEAESADKGEDAQDEEAGQDSVQEEEDESDVSDAGAEVTEATVSIEDTEENSLPPEKVSDEDSVLEKDGGEAPTTDEKNRVHEYQIFEEPEVVVHDLPEETEESEKIAGDDSAASSEPEASPEEDSKKTEESHETTEEPRLAEMAASEPPAKAAQNEETESKSKENEESNKEIENKEETPEEKPIVPSRSASLKVNQYLDVVYPGNGWVYIGETGTEPLFNYFGRKLGTGNTTFALRAKKSGKTLLHFYKNDALTGEYIDDYLEVDVQNKKGTGRIKAPSYAEIIPAKPQRRIDRATEKAQAEKEERTAPEIVNKVPESEQKAPESKENAPKTEEKASESVKKAPEKPPVSSSPSTATQSTPLSSPAQPLRTAESDVKTVIQTTEQTEQKDSINLKGDDEIQGQKQEETTARNEGENNLQFQNYIPTSSQSDLSDSDSVITEEPDVILETQNTSPDESLLDQAKEDFVSGKFEDALNKAQEYYNNASSRLDEALFLLGQISESNSSVRDIRFAVDSYDMLVKRFPASPLWKQAKNRSIYLKRFYIDIR